MRTPEDYKKKDIDVITEWRSLQSIQTKRQLPMKRVKRKQS